MYLLLLKKPYETEECNLNTFKSYILKALYLSN